MPDADLRSSLMGLRQEAVERGWQVGVPTPLWERWVALPASKAKHWNPSRRALAGVLRKSLQTWDAERHTLLLSLAHTHGLSIAAALISREACGIGVDCEPADRTLSQALHARILHPGDDIRLAPIELWSLKEAMYKADPFRIPSLSSYCVQACEDGSLEATGPQSSFACSKVRHGGFLIAVAICSQIRSEP